LRNHVCDVQIEPGTVEEVLASSPAKKPEALWVRIVTRSAVVDYV